MAVAAVAAWVGYKAIIEQGPQITITFETARDLEAGKTKIMYKGVQAGTIDSIGISDDLQSAVVHATMAKQVSTTMAAIADVVINGFNGFNRGLEDPAVTHLVAIGVVADDDIERAALNGSYQLVS